MNISPSIKSRHLKDKLAEKGMFLLCLIFVGVIAAIVFGLYSRARPIFEVSGLGDLLLSSVWHPKKAQFGLANFIAGTFWVTAIAIVLAVPLSLLTAIYLSQYAHRKVREWLKPLIDLLAGISPVIYGVWGVIVIVPFVRDFLMPFFSRRFPFFPFATENFTGYSALSAGIVLAVMTFPIIISIVEEVLRSVSFELKESSLALGATKWQMIKTVVLKKSWPGIVAAIILGLSRAFGETIAVLMVAGCSLGTSLQSIFDPAYPLPAFIANTYGEMMSIPLYDSAVLLAAFVLLVVTVIFNMIGWGLLLRLERVRAA